MDPEILGITHAVIISEFRDWKAVRYPRIDSPIFDTLKWKNDRWRQEKV